MKTNPNSLYVREYETWKCGKHTRIAVDYLRYAETPKVVGFRADDPAVSI